MRFPGIARRIIVVLALACLAAPVLGAPTSHSSQADGRPTVGLVLSGGGARGVAHVGVLRVLEEMQVPVDYVAGTSMGAIIGGLYASGLSADEIARAIENMDWNAMFRDHPDRKDRSFRRKSEDRRLLVKAQPGLDFRTGELKLPLGFIEGQRITLAIKDLTTQVATVSDFDLLPTPFRAVATDIGTGQAVVLGSGDLALSITASMAIPGVFSPTRLDGRVLVDGGITNNLPMDVARSMGADILIVVDISTPLHPPEALSNPLIITDQLTSIMTRSNTERNLATLSSRDILIVPDLGDITSVDFERAQDAKEEGYRAADAIRSRLAAISLANGDYQRWRNLRDSRTELPPMIEFIDISTDVRLDPAILRDKIEHPTGHRLEPGQMDRDIGTLYGMGLFEKISYQVVERDGRHGVLVNARAKRWGPDYLQFGMDLEDDFEGDTLFNLRVAYLRTAMNSLGAEWRSEATVGEEPRLFTGWYQPLDQDQLYFVHPTASWGKRNVNVFEDGKRVAEYRLTEYGLGLAAGRELGTWGEVRAGYRRSEISSSLRVGEPSNLDADYSEGVAFLRFEVDELDNVNFPTEGHWGFVDYGWHRDAFGDDGSFDQLAYGADIVLTWDRLTVRPGISGGTSLNGTAPVSRLFELGGFLRLSGLERNELSGEDYLLARTVVYRRINKSEFLPVYFGGSLEYGSIGDDVDLQDGKAAGSLFLGVDSVIGPIYIGGGWAEGGNGTGFMFLGRRF
jgi:NTE family protein